MRELLQHAAHLLRKSSKRNLQDFPCEIVDDEEEQGSSFELVERVDRTRQAPIRRESTRLQSAAKMLRSWRRADDAQSECGTLERRGGPTRLSGKHRARRNPERSKGRNSCERSHSFLQASEGADRVTGAYGESARSRVPVGAGSDARTVYSTSTLPRVLRERKSSRKLTKDSGYETSPYSESDYVSLSTRSGSAETLMDELKRLEKRQPPLQQYLTEEYLTGINTSSSRPAAALETTERQTRPGSISEGSDLGSVNSGSTLVADCPGFSSHRNTPTMNRRIVETRLTSPSQQYQSYPSTRSNGASRTFDASSVSTRTETIRTTKRERLFNPANSTRNSLTPSYAYPRRMTSQSSMIDDDHEVQQYVDDVRLSTQQMLPKNPVICTSLLNGIKCTNPLANDFPSLQTAVKDRDSSLIRSIGCDNSRSSYGGLGEVPGSAANDGAVSGSVLDETEGPLAYELDDIDEVLREDTDGYRPNSSSTPRLLKEANARPSPISLSRTWHSPGHEKLPSWPLPGCHSTFPYPDQMTRRSSSLVSYQDIGALRTQQRLAQNYAAAQQTGGLHLLPSSLKRNPSDERQNGDSGFLDGFHLPAIDKNGYRVFDRAYSVPSPPERDIDSSSQDSGELLRCGSSDVLVERVKAPPVGLSSGVVYRRPVHTKRFPPEMKDTVRHVDALTGRDSLTTETTSSGSRDSSESELMQMHGGSFSDISLLSSSTYRSEPYKQQNNEVRGSYTSNFRSNVKKNRYHKKSSQNSVSSSVARFSSTEGGDVVGSQFRQCLTTSTEKSDFAKRQSESKNHIQNYYCSQRFVNASEECTDHDGTSVDPVNISVPRASLASNGASLANSVQVSTKASSGEIGSPSSLNLTDSGNPDTLKSIQRRAVLQYYRRRMDACQLPQEASGTPGQVKQKQTEPSGNPGVDRFRRMFSHDTSFSLDRRFTKKTAFSTARSCSGSTSSLRCAAQSYSVENGLSENTHGQLDHRLEDLSHNSVGQRVEVDDHSQGSHHLSSTGDLSNRSPSTGYMDQADSPCNRNHCKITEVTGATHRLEEPRPSEDSACVVEPPQHGFQDLHASPPAIPSVFPSQSSDASHRDATDGGPISQRLSGMVETGGSTRRKKPFLRALSESTLLQMAALRRRSSGRAVAPSTHSPAAPSISKKTSFSLHGRPSFLRVASNVETRRVGGPGSLTASSSCAVSEECLSLPSSLHEFALPSSSSTSSPPSSGRTGSRSFTSSLPRLASLASRLHRRSHNNVAVGEESAKDFLHPSRRGQHSLQQQQLRAASPLLQQRVSEEGSVPYQGSSFVASPDAVHAVPEAVFLSTDKPSDPTENDEHLTDLTGTYHKESCAVRQADWRSSYEGKYKRTASPGTHQQPSSLSTTSSSSSGSIYSRSISFSKEALQSAAALRRAQFSRSVQGSVARPSDQPKSLVRQPVSTVIFTEAELQSFRPAEEDSTSGEKQLLRHQQLSGGNIGSGRSLQHAVWRSTELHPSSNDVDDLVVHQEEVQRSPKNNREVSSGYSTLPARRPRTERNKSCDGSDDAVDVSGGRQKKSPSARTNRSPSPAMMRGGKLTAFRSCDQLLNVFEHADTSIVIADQSSASDLQIASQELKQDPAEMMFRTSPVAGPQTPIRGDSLSSSSSSSSASSSSATLADSIVAVAPSTKPLKEISTPSSPGCPAAAAAKHVEGHVEAPAATERRSCTVRHQDLPLEVEFRRFCQKLMADRPNLPAALRNVLVTAPDELGTCCSDVRDLCDPTRGDGTCGNESCTVRTDTCRSAAHTPESTGRRPISRASVDKLSAGLALSLTKFLDRIREDDDDGEEQETWSDDLSSRPSEDQIELVSRISGKLSVLRSERGSIAEEMSGNVQLGSCVLEWLQQLGAVQHQLDKYQTYVQQIATVTSLLLGLAGRLARAQNQLNTATAADKVALTDKRDKLRAQLDEAGALKRNIDARGQQVETMLQQFLSDAQMADYQHFISMKAKLIVDAREVDDKLRLGEEQLAASVTMWDA